MFWLYEFIFGSLAFYRTHLRTVMLASVPIALLAAVFHAAVGLSALNAGVVAYCACGVLFVVAAICYGIAQIGRVK